MYNLVQKETVQKHKVLHHDASPFNILIYEALDGVCSMLIDWEFAVKITLWAEYSVGGTVSMVFFMLGITTTNVELGYYSISFHQTSWANLKRT